MTYPNKNSQQRPKNQLRKPKNWQLSLLKMVISILLPYLLSSPDISIYIYHIIIALPS
ncbi:hypothetical protein [Psychrobacter immobilis]|uniref:hypothetical protein n=1 Tax=Psychrobacter immobilis TaxID=498 RepID=UPI0019181DFD|nr:hypothetical protein [Psychrobacter immobilis]